MLSVWMPCGGHFDVEAKEEDLRELNARIEDPTLWNNPEEAQRLMQERARVEKVLKEFKQAASELDDASMLF